MLLYITLGLTYGFAAAVQPGPFQTYLISQTLSVGWKRTIPKTLAPLISDVPIACLALLVMSQLPSWLERFLHFGGGLFVIYLAYGAYCSWRAFDPPGSFPVTPRQDSIWKAVSVNLLNPNPYIGWSLVTGPLVLKGWRDAPGNAVALVAVFYSTIVLTTSGIILLFALARNLGPRVDRFMLGLSALALAAFGLYQLYLGFIPS
jgi:threonine/homoserine/homoserine lactone efflux protein